MSTNDYYEKYKQFYTAQAYGKLPPNLQQKDGSRSLNKTLQWLADKQTFTLDTPTEQRVERTEKVVEKACNKKNPQSGKKRQCIQTCKKPHKRIKRPRSK
jgi:hypothetical protein